ncbi:MAG: hypothetical protein M1833_006830 [Piccolia ochrophora]|nr:MAG: hypothetical protein M1833_006830 [Piccolia ochrophora]
MVQFSTFVPAVLLLAGVSASPVAPLPEQYTLKLQVNDPELEGYYLSSSHSPAGVSDTVLVKTVEEADTFTTDGTQQAVYWKDAFSGRLRLASDPAAPPNKQPIQIAGEPGDSTFKFNHFRHAEGLRYYLTSDDEGYQGFTVCTGEVPRIYWVKGEKSTPPSADKFGAPPEQCYYSAALYLETKVASPAPAPAPAK